MFRYRDVVTAIEAACALTYHCVGRDLSKGPGASETGSAAEEWVIYPTAGGAPQGIQPDMLCIKPGTIPIPMTPEGTRVLRSLIGGLTCADSDHREYELACEQHFSAANAGLLR